MAKREKAYQLQAPSKDSPDGAVLVTLYRDGSTSCQCQWWQANNTCDHVTAALVTWAGEGKFAGGKVRLGVGAPAGADPTPPAEQLPLTAAPAQAEEAPPAEAAKTEPAPVAAAPAQPSAPAVTLKPATAVAIAPPVFDNDSRLVMFLERGDLPSGFGDLPADIRAMQMPVLQGLPTPTDWSRIVKLAAVWLRAGFTGVDETTGKPTDTLASLTAKLMLGSEYGFTPMESLRHMFSFTDKRGRGSVGMHAAGMLALCHRKIAGFKLDILQRDNLGSKIRVYRDGQEPADFSFTIEDAKTAGLTTNWTYTKHPKRMCWARVVSDMANSYCADALGSTLTLEEAEELQETPQPAAPTPPSTPPTIAATAAAFAQPAAATAATPAP